MSLGKLNRAILRTEPPLEAGSRNLSPQSYPRATRWRASTAIRRLKSTGPRREEEKQAGPRSRTPSERVAAHIESPHTGEADIDLTPEIPRSIDRCRCRCYTWSRPPSPSACQPPSPASPSSGGMPASAYSRWWKVWGLTHGLAAANPWILVVATAPCRVFRSGIAAAADDVAAATATAREGAAATRWRGGLRGQTFQSHPDGETRRDAPAIGSPSVLVSIPADLSLSLFLSRVPLFVFSCTISLTCFSRFRLLLFLPQRCTHSWNFLWCTGSFGRNR